MRSDRVAHKTAASSAVNRSSVARQLGQLAAHPQPRQRQGRVGAAGHHHVQAGRRVLDQERQRLVDHRVLDHVVVVQHQDQLLGLRGQLVDDLGDEALNDPEAGEPSKAATGVARPGRIRSTAAAM